MSGIIFALKSKKTNLSMKMESCVKQDPRGVYFYSQSKVALDMLELGADEIGRLISEARLSGNYEYVIADLEFGMDRASLQILRQAGCHRLDRRRLGDIQPEAGTGLSGVGNLRAERRGAADGTDRIDLQ